MFPKYSIPSPIVATSFAATSALAAEYLTEITSEVYQTSGTPREIAQRSHLHLAKPEARNHERPAYRQQRPRQRDHRCA